MFTLAASAMACADGVILRASEPEEVAPVPEAYQGLPVHSLKRCSGLDLGSGRPP